MKCIVTGVAGFIGSHLAERILRDKHSVIGIDCFTDYYPREFKENNLRNLRSRPEFDFWEVNLLDADLPAFFRNVDVVFHLAAQAGVRASWGEQFRIYTDLNVLGTQRVLEAALEAGVKRVVYASSSSVYGDVNTFPMRVTDTPHPVSPYGVTKLAAEHLCVLYTKNFNLPTVSLRYFTVYGPRQRPDMAFHIFGKALLSGNAPQFFGNGHQTRDFTFVSDAVEATYSAGIAQGVEGRVFNVGGGSRVSLLDVWEILKKISGKQVTPVFMETQKGDVRHTAADITPAQKYLDYQPEIPLEIGLEREFRWLESVYQKGDGANGGR